MTDISDLNLFFTLTTGRSGTGYLAEILNMVSGITAYHESEPKFQIFKYPNEYERFLQDIKIPHILKNHDPTKIYVETSHLFGKGYYKPLINLGWTPKVIYLHRNKREVALSLLALNTIPEKTEKGNKFLLTNDHYCVEDYYKYNAEKLTDYQLCYLYTIRVEYVSKKIISHMESIGGEIVEINYNDMFSYKVFPKIEKILKNTIVNKHEITKVFNKKVNSKNNNKESVNLSIDEIRDMEDEVIEKFK